MQKFLKIAMLVGLGLGILILTTLVVVFIKLPSMSAIGKAVAAKTKVVTPVTTQNISQDLSVAKIESQNANLTAASVAQVPAKQDPALRRALLDDIISRETPLSDFCGSLKSAKVGQFNSNEEVDQAMQNSVLTDNKDPRVQALKPTFRYMMRLPKLNELVHQAAAASEAGDESLFQKAEFYTKALSAFSEIKDHKKDIESVMDRSYFLLNLNKIVAMHSELLLDSRLQNYCANVELAFNQSTPISYEQERNDFDNFLKDLNLKPSDIGYDPKYKTHIEFEMSAQNISLKGSSWLSEIFKEDEPAVAEDAALPANGAVR